MNQEITRNPANVETGYNPANNSPVCYSGKGGPSLKNSRQLMIQTQGLPAALLEVPGQSRTNEH